MVFKCKRFDSIEFGRKPKLIDNVYDNSKLFSEKIVDDSTYVPNSSVLRNALTSVNPLSKGVYDFSDGIDNGFNPVARRLDLDVAEVDEAAKKVVKDADNLVKSKSKQDSDKAKQERNDRILDALDSLSSQPDSEGSQSSE